jgi:RecQ-mediated genome instability protein 1
LQREQYLFSDLAASTLSDVIPPTAHNITLFPQPTLLHIASFTEIGSSAFQLQTVLEQRKEVISGATRIRRMEDEEQDEGEDVGDGEQDKMPQYPRGMLKLQLSDGNRIINAIEYKRLPGLKLGETCLGAKLVLHRVRALRGTCELETRWAADIAVLLRPATTRVLGYEVAALEAEQPITFVNSLNVRMGKTAPAAPAEMPVVATQAPPARRTAVRPRAPTQAASTTRLTLPPNPPRTASTPNATRHRALPEPVASPYFAQSSTRSVKRPRTAPETKPRVSAAYSIDDDDDDFDDSFIRQIEEAEAMAAGVTGPSKRPADTDYHDIDDDDDDDWFAEVDMEELDKLDKVSAVPARSTGSASRRGGPARGEVIEISD